MKNIEILREINALSYCDPNRDIKVYESLQQLVGLKLIAVKNFNFTVSKRSVICCGNIKEHRKSRGCKLHCFKTKDIFSIQQITEDEIVRKHFYVHLHVGCRKIKTGYWSLLNMLEKGKLSFIDQSEKPKQN